MTLTFDLMTSIPIGAVYMLCPTSLPSSQLDKTGKAFCGKGHCDIDLWPDDLNINKFWRGS